MKTERMNIENCLANEDRWKMTELANSIAEENKEFTRNQIINVGNFGDKFTNNRQVLRAHFLVLIKSGVFSRQGNKQKYVYNREVVLEHSEAIKQLTI